MGEKNGNDGTLNLQFIKEQTDQYFSTTVSSSK